MAFGEWKGHAYMDDLRNGRHVSIRIGREVAHNDWEVVTRIDGEMGTTCQRVRLENEEAIELGSVLFLDFQVSLALYTALHRIHGDSDSAGSREALAVERRRVDMLINSMLHTKAVPAQ